jgi:hypothetical protein
MVLYGTTRYSTVLYGGIGSGSLGTIWGSIGAPSTKTKTTGPRRQQCALTDSWCTSIGCSSGCTGPAAPGDTRAGARTLHAVGCVVLCCSDGCLALFLLLVGPQVSTHVPLVPVLCGADAAHPCSSAQQRGFACRMRRTSTARPRATESPMIHTNRSPPCVRACGCGCVCACEGVRFYVCVCMWVRAYGSGACRCVRGCVRVGACV